MTVTSTWTNPSEGGTLDRDSGQTIREQDWDAVLSNLLFLGGVAGVLKASALGVQVLGNVGIGQAPSSNVGLGLSGPLPGGFGIANNVSGVGAGYVSNAGVVGGGNNYAQQEMHLSGTFASGGFTNLSAYRLQLDAFTAPAGFQNAYGIHIGVPSGASTENYGVKNLGTSFLGGAVGIGGIIPQPGTMLTLTGLGAWTAGVRYLCYDAASGAVKVSSIGPTS